MFLWVPVGRRDVCPKGRFDPAQHLAQGDVRIDGSRDPGYIVVWVKASRTGPFRKGVSVYLGRTGRSTCPMAAVTGYKVQRATKEGPFFQFEDGHSLTWD